MTRSLNWYSLSQPMKDSSLNKCELGCIDRDNPCSLRLILAICIMTLSRLCTCVCTVSEKYWFEVRRHLIIYYYMPRCEKFALSNARTTDTLIDQQSSNCSISGMWHSILFICKINLHVGHRRENYLWIRFSFALSH